MRTTPEPEDDEPKISEAFLATEHLKWLRIMIVKQDPALDVAQYVLEHRAAFKEHIAASNTVLKDPDDALPDELPE